ncbi:unnamed protein product [Prunus armeniaca]|uniref:Uncharacterized protein n=1 Tax=Prunus armeniaca TaxID=36596 RepID=A0A6J5WUI9_PRUAR|nr:unnamed protein product [Prunus armeniaca]
MQILVHSNFFAKDQQVQLPVRPNNNNNNENVVHQDLDDEAEEKAVVVYSLTPASRLLLKESPVLIDPFHLMGTWCHMNSNGNHDHPASPFEMAHGRSFWGLAAQQPKLGSLFNDAMEADSQLLARAVVEDVKEFLRV